MAESQIILIIVAMSIGNMFLRVAPVVCIPKRVAKSPIVHCILCYIPVTVIAAMVFPAILVKNNELANPLYNSHLFAALPTALAAYFTKSIIVAIIVGVVTLVALKELITVSF